MTGPAEHHDGEVAIPVVVARRILRLLDGLGESGVMGYRGNDAFEPACDPVPEAAELARALYQKMKPTLDVGDRVTDGDTVGRVVALVLLPSGWEVHVNWEDGGIALTSIDRLAPAVD